jgi:hypothetical protein
MADGTCSGAPWRHFSLSRQAISLSGHIKHQNALYRQQSLSVTTSEEGSLETLAASTVKA